MSGFVYAIRAGDSDHVKIGYSTNPARRLASLRSGHSLPLRLVATASAGRRQEERLHSLLGEFTERLHGEWFNLPLVNDSVIRDLFALIELWRGTSRAERDAAIDLLDLVARPLVQSHLALREAKAERGDQPSFEPTHSNAPGRSSRQTSAARGVNTKEDR